MPANWKSDYDGVERSFNLWSDRRVLSAGRCYAGQKVFRVMWADATELSHRDTSDRQSAFYSYIPGRTPEMWCFVVEKAHKNGVIVVREHGVMRHSVYSCEIDAVNSAYEIFCRQVLDPLKDGFPSANESARVLQTLADIQEGIHRSVARKRL